jgi:hypothetical protein
MGNLSNGRNHERPQTKKPIKPADVDAEEALNDTTIKAVGAEVR